MDCPKCIGKLEKIEVGRNNPITIDRCFACGGLWFDKEELSGVINRQILDTVETEITSKPLENSALWDKINFNQKKGFCPRCKIEMHKEKSPRESKIMIDYCPKCEGVWLDAGEFDVINSRSNLEKAFESVIDFFRVHFAKMFKGKKKD